jgi:hypothetical protein
MPATRPRRSALALAPVAPTVAPAASRGLSSLIDAMTLSLLALFGLLLVGALLWAQGATIDALRAELDARPPVAVIDYAPVATAVAEGVAPEAIEPLFRAIKERSEALRAEGFLVLNRAAIDGAPEALVVRVDPPPAAMARASALPPALARAPAPGPARAPAARATLTDDEARALIGAMTGGASR